MIVRAHQGDTLDALCHRHLGSTIPLEAALLANPGLAALGPFLPDGTPVHLPDPSAAQSAPATILQLWD